MLLAGLLALHPNLLLVLLLVLGIPQLLRLGGSREGEGQGC